MSSRNVLSATAVEPSATKGSAPNPPPTPEERPDPTTGSGRTAFLVPTFLGNNVPRGDLGAIDGGGAGGSSTNVRPGGRHSGVQNRDGTGRGTPPPRPPEPVGKRPGAAHKGVGEKEAASLPRPRSRMARTNARTSGRRASPPATAAGTGGNHRRTLLLLGLGVVALGIAVGLGLFLLPGEAHDEQDKVAEDNGSVVRIGGEEENGGADDVVFTWRDGRFPRYSNEPEVRRTLRVVAPAPVEQVRINGERLRRGELSWRGFSARLLDPDGEPIDGRLSHEEFQIEMSVQEDQESTRFEIELVHAEGTHDTVFETRIDRMAPRVRFTRPRDVRRDRRREARDNLAVPFLVNETDVEVRLRVHDIVGLEAVSFRRWDGRDVEVPVEDPNEVSYESVFEFPGDGEYRVHVEATDKAGNVTELLQDFIVDTEPPSIHILSSEGESPVFTVEESEITVQGIVEDDNGVRSVVRYDDDLDDDLQSPSRVSITVDGERGDTRRRFSIAMSLGIGENYIDLAAEDVARNRSTSRLVITRTDPNLPRLVEVRLDGVSVWREGRDLDVRLDEEREEPVELEVTVLELEEPQVRVAGQDLELDPSATYGARYVFYGPVHLYDGMELEIHVIDGLEQVETFVFSVRGVIPEPVRALREVDRFDVEGFFPPPHEPYRRAACFDFDGQRVVSVTAESVPELLVYDEGGELVSQNLLRALEGAAPERVRWIGTHRVAISTEAGEVAIYSTQSGEPRSNALEIEPGSPWYADIESGLMVLQRPSGELFLLDTRRAGRAFTLPVTGRPDGPVTILRNGRYVAVSREGTLTVWSVTQRRLVATLDIEARHLLADPDELGVWYAVMPGGVLARFEGFLSDEPVAQRPLPGEIRSLTLLDEERFVVQTGEGESAEWHMVARDLGASQSFPAPRLMSLRPVEGSGSGPLRFWGLSEGYIVRVRLDEQ